MTAGPVNRALLESFFQNPGEIYDDSKTEGCLDVLADQIDENWVDYAAVKTALNSTTLGSSGTQYVQSPSIVGVTGNNAYLQILSLKSQIDAIVGASIPPGSINTAMIQDGAVTYPKLSPAPSSTATAGSLMLYDANGRSQVAAPAVDNDIANKNYSDLGNTYYALSDAVLVSLPTERSQPSGSVLKSYNIKNAGRYRIKGEFRSNTNGTAAGLAIKIGVSDDDASLSDNLVTASTTSNVYSNFTLDCPYMPENCRINIHSFGSAIVFVRNVTLCGSPVIGNANTFSGVD